MPHHVSKAQFSELVDRAVEELPDEFARFLEEVPIEIRDRPTPVQRKSLRMEGGHILLGLYHGRPLTRRSVQDSGTLSDVIYIFQDGIEAVSKNERELVEQVRKTVLHEIGHLFGLDEEDLKRLGYG